MPGWKRKGWRKARRQARAQPGSAQGHRRRHCGPQATPSNGSRATPATTSTRPPTTRRAPLPTAYQAKRQPPRGPGFPGAAGGGATAELEPTAAVRDRGSKLRPPCRPRPRPSSCRATSSRTSSPPWPTRNSALSPAPRPTPSSPWSASSWTPSVRADAAAWPSLLHPDFEEIGASGRLWTRDAVLVSMDQVRPRRHPWTCSLWPAGPCHGPADLPKHRPPGDRAAQLPAGGRRRPVAPALPPGHSGGVDI